MSKELRCAQRPTLPTAAKWAKRRWGGSRAILLRYPAAPNPDFPWPGGSGLTVVSKPCNRSPRLQSFQRMNQTGDTLSPRHDNRKPCGRSPFPTRLRCRLFSTAPGRPKCYSCEAQILSAEAGTCCSEQSGSDDSRKHSPFSTRAEQSLPRSFPGVPRNRGSGWCSD